MYRYVALIWDAEDLQQDSAVRDLTARLTDSASQWVTVFDCDGLRVWCADLQPESLGAHLLSEGRGVVLGALFHRHVSMMDESACQKVVVDSHVSAEILESGGDWLVSSAWGNYVALLYDSTMRTTRIIKDPCGDLAAFATRFKGVTIVFSALADCWALDLRTFTVNREFLELRLAYGECTFDVDALNEVFQIRRGECVEVDPRRAKSVVRRFCWTPLHFPHCDERVQDAPSAEHALRSAVTACVLTWAACHRSVLLRLSGGLDSSIVLSYLAGASSSLGLLCYTHFAPGGPSDPRMWARIAAEEAGCPLAELAVDPEALRLDAIPGMAPSPEPSSALMYLVAGEYEQRVAWARGATAVFTGDGGDSSFGRHCVSEAVHTYLRHRGLRPSVLPIAARAASALHDSTASLFFRGLRAWLSGGAASSPSSRCTPSMKLVARSAHTAVSFEERHPWFAGVDRVPWETVSKLGMLLATPNAYSAAGTPTARAPQVISPLYAQPLIELSLRIPADVLFADGRDRGLARRAFGERLPAAIAAREWKDRPAHFYDIVIARHREWLRGIFLDGVLVANGLLDRGALEQALSAKVAKTDVSAGEILHHLDTELWARQFAH